MNDQVVIVGGGVIGLSIAFELALRGESVTVVETGEFARQASWAGAGMLPPAKRTTAVHPLEHLEAISNRTHADWAARLTELTKIDTGHRRCGGLYLARTPGEVAATIGAMREWDDRLIEYEQVDASSITGRFSFASQIDLSKVKIALWAPSAAQFHTPHHNQALIAACQKLNVTLLARQQDVSVQVRESRVTAIKTSTQEVAGHQFVFAAGAWTGVLLKTVGVLLPMQPVRGQMALYRVPPSVAEMWASAPIVNEGSRYLVPRTDGHVLAGATIEEVGFSSDTTDEEIADLRNWSQSVSASLNSSTYLRSWAGLRPGTFDGFPYLGPLEELGNAWVATGHFKSGLQLSTGTAGVIADLVQNKPTEIDLIPFLPSRVHLGRADSGKTASMGNLNQS